MFTKPGMWVSIATTPKQAKLVVSSVSFVSEEVALKKGSLSAQKTFGVTSSEVRIEAVELMRGDREKTKRNVRMALWRLGVPAANLEEMSEHLFEQMLKLLKK